MHDPSGLLARTLLLVPGPDLRRTPPPRDPYPSIVPPEPTEGRPGKEDALRYLREVDATYANRPEITAAFRQVLKQFSLGQ